MSKELRMPRLNIWYGAGNLTREVELKYLPSGMAVCEFGVACSEKRKDKKTGELIEDTVFVDVTCWGKVAEWVGTSFTKGDPVIVEGKLKMDSWEDKQTGQKRTKLKINAFSVQPLSWSKDGGPSQYQGQEQHSSGGGQTNQPHNEIAKLVRESEELRKPRPIEEPIPEDDIPF